MPKRLGIDVNVTDCQNNPFIEYGQQSDRRFTTDKSRVSTFIEAKNGAQFRIRVTVDNPFKFQETLDPVARLAAALNSDGNRPAEEELRSFTGVTPAITKVPFDLMVSVFIDGRAKPECRQMIYLDPKHPRYNSHCILKGRWVDPGDASSRDGKAGLLQWVFSDRGINHILEQLDVNKVLSKTSTNLDEADFEAMREKLGEDLLEDPKDQHMKAGQIEVRIRRVICMEGDPVDQKFKAYHYAGSDENPRDMDDDCTHTTSFLPKTTSTGSAKIETFALRHVAWAYYKNGEDFWQKFIFNYTARHKLVNFGLSGLDGKPTLMARTCLPEPEPSSKRGKKRASSVGVNDSDEDVLPKKPRGNGESTGVRNLRSNRGSYLSESSVSEEDPDNTDAFCREQEGKYDLRPTRVRKDNFIKAKDEDDADRIS